MTAIQALPSLDMNGGLSRYLRDIRKFPVLSPEDEYMLAKRWREHDEVAAAHQLVTSHLRLVAKMAWGFRHYGLPLGDLIAEGNLGLMQAVKKFDPERGFRLATYAVWWVKAALQEHVLRSWSLVRVGSVAAHKKLFFNLRRVKAQLAIVDGGELTPDDVKRIATQMEVGEDDVVAMNARLAGRDASLNVPVYDDATGEAQDFLVDHADNQEVALAERQQTRLNQHWLSAGLDALDARERLIITERRLQDEPTTLEDLGRRLGVSRERVRQIENKAFDKLKAAVMSARG